MWPALEGFVVIIGLILLFGIISLPPRYRKARSRVPVRLDTAEQLAGNQTSRNLRDAQKGTPNGSGQDTYSADQRLSATPSAAAEGN
jgi:hypothetical protein